MERSGIGTYVEHVTLLQPLYASMDFDDFIYAVKISKASDDWCIKNMMGTASSATDLISWNPTTAQIAEGYLRYNAIAVESALQLRTSNALLDAWVPLLRLFSRCTSFEIPMVDYFDFNPDFSPRKPRQALGPCTDRLKKLSCKTAAMFVPKAVACLAAAHCKVETLVLGHGYWRDVPRSLTSDGIWTCDCKWEDVDLNNLKSLTLHLKLPSSLDDRDERWTLLDLRKDFQCLLSLCAPSLQSVEYTNKFYSVHVPPTMDSLTEVSFEECEVSSRWFRRWLLTMPQLQWLKMGTERSRRQTMRLTDEESDAWMDVLDALRDHPTLVSGCLQIAFSASWTLAFDKEDVLEDWTIDDRGYDEAQRTYWGKKREMFEKVLEDPREFRRLLDEEHERGDDLSRERLGRFYVCGAIEWPGIERLEKEME